MRCSTVARIRSNWAATDGSPPNAGDGVTAEGYDGDGSVVVRRLLHHPILEHPFNRAEWTPEVVKATLTLTRRLVLS